MKRHTAVRAFLLAGLGATMWPAVFAAQAPAQASASPAVDSRIWIGHATEIEDYLRTVPMEKLEDLSVGVTKPKKAHLPPGGPVQYLVWKMIPPGRYTGYWESYKSEIAAYELDKMLGLNMVPPTVEKEHRGERGAAIMWVSPSKSFQDMGLKGAPVAPPIQQASWARQLVKAKMFHNLIANVDPNLGNWLVDPAWNLILIDFSRCFTNTRDMPHALTRVDADLWDRMKGMTEESLTPTLGKLLGRGELRAILQRRDRMAKLIADLVKEHGEDFVFMRGQVQN